MHSKQRGRGMQRGMLVITKRRESHTEAARGLWSYHRKQIIRERKSARRPIQTWCRKEKEARLSVRRAKVKELLTSNGKSQRKFTAITAFKFRGLSVGTTASWARYQQQDVIVDYVSRIEPEIEGSYTARDRGESVRERRDSWQSLSCLFSFFRSQLRDKSLSKPGPASTTESPPMHQATAWSLFRLKRLFFTYRFNLAAKFLLFVDKFVRR